MKTMMLLLGSALALAGCVDSELEDDVTADPTPRLSANGLLPSDLKSVAWNPGALTQSQLDAYAATAAGRNALRYVGVCALPLGTTLYAHYTDGGGDPAEVRVAGVIGLAPNWATTALTVAEQQFVTSCAMSLTNAAGALVTISQRGPSPDLATTSTELADFTIQEGAYFGNMFLGEMFVCRGSGTSSQPGRICASGSSCYPQAGSCATVCSTANGYFVNCSFKTLVFPTPVTVYDSN